MDIKHTDTDTLANLVERLRQGLVIPESVSSWPIGWEQAAYLAGLVLDHPTADKPLRTMEVGLGLGCSAAAILICNRSSHHVVISKDDDLDRQNIGLENARLFDERSALEFLEGDSHRHLPALASQGELFDLVHIDAGHKFDETLVEFYYVSRMTAPGGIVIFDDTWMPSIKSVLAWIETNLSHKWEPVTGTPKYSAAFRNNGNPDDRHWEHFVPFRTEWRRSPAIFRSTERFLRKRLLSMLGRA